VAREFAYNAERTKVRSLVIIGAKQASEGDTVRMGRAFGSFIASPAF